MRADKRRTGREQGAPIEPSIILIAFSAIAAGVLSYPAFQKAQGAGIGDATSVIGSVAVSPKVVVTEGAVSVKGNLVIEPSPVETESQHAIRPNRALALKGSVAVRASVRECGAPGAIGFSTDGGSTWFPLTSFIETPSTRVLRPIPEDGRTFVIALDQYCEPQIRLTSDGGRTWTGPVSATGTWYLDPSHPSELCASGGQRSRSYETLHLYKVSGHSVGVLCFDVTVITTADRGATWSELSFSEIMFTLTHFAENLLLSAQRGGSCVTLLISTSQSEGLSGIETDMASAAAGRTTAAQSADVLLLWVGDNLTSSKDGGQIWL